MDMRGRFLTVLALAVLGVASVTVAIAPDTVHTIEQSQPLPLASKNKVFFWLCLERCNGTAATIAANLKQIEDNKDFLSGISFELYNIGPNSTLVTNKDLTNVNDPLRAMGMPTYPMVSSYPYPKNLIDWLRQVWADPDPFLDQLASEAAKYGYAGYNLDWEPTTGATAQDAETYAKFLGYASQKLAASGVQITVAAGTWSPIWNFTLMAQEPQLSKVCTMSTYTTTNKTWVSKVEQAVTELQPSGKLAIGLMTPQTNPYSDEVLDYRFGLLNSLQVTEIWIWKFSMALPENWWPFVKAFVNRASTSPSGQPSPGSPTPNPSPSANSSPAPGARKPRDPTVIIIAVGVSAAVVLFSGLAVFWWWRRRNEARYASDALAAQQSVTGAFSRLADTDDEGDPDGGNVW